MNNSGSNAFHSLMPDVILRQKFSLFLLLIWTSQLQIAQTEYTSYYYVKSFLKIPKVVD